MSDFIDRLAARAIGGEAALAPRLPSLFEPLSRAPIMPPPDEGDAPVRARDADPAVPPAPGIATPPHSPPHARESTEQPAARAASVERSVLPTPAPAATVAPHEPMPASLPVASPVRTITADQAGAPPTAERPVATPSPVSPGPPRMTPARRGPALTPAPTGALLPAPAPVFAATGVASVRPERTATARTAAARAENGLAATAEPVVYVSIGRLEVRAAPATAAPTQRREGPRPSSLDDYLRQRGKASP
jgi:hypothetical protein